MLAWFLRVRVPQPVSRSIFAAAAALLLCALFAPRALAPVERAWMALGHAMSRFTTPVIYTLLWWTAFVPIGIVRRTLGRSPLHRDANAPTYWVRRVPTSPELARAAMERQF